MILLPLGVLISIPLEQREEAEEEAVERPDSLVVSLAPLPPLLLPPLPPL